MPRVYPRAHLRLFRHNTLVHLCTAAHSTSATSYQQQSPRRLDALLLSSGAMERDVHTTARSAAQAHTRNSPASVQVLTNSTLFAGILGYVDGVPRFVLQFKDDLTQLQTTSTSVYREHTRLWQTAVLSRNKRVLDALKTLATTQDHRRGFYTRFVGIVSFALLHTDGNNSDNDDNLDFLDWLFETFNDEPQRRVDPAAIERLVERSHYDTALLVWLKRRNYALPTTIMDNAAGSGNLTLLRSLHKQGVFACSTKAMDSAAAAGHLHVVQFLHKNRTEGCTREAQASALRNGHVNVLKYLRAHRTEGYARHSVTQAAANGRLQCIQYAHTHGFEGFSVWTMSDAVVAGHLDVVKFLHTNRSEGCTLESVIEAAKRGHDRIVDFLSRNRPVANAASAFKQATHRGDARIVDKLARRMSVSLGRQYQYAVGVWRPRSI